jgi:hypothetical protein
LKDRLESEDEIFFLRGLKKDLVNEKRICNFAAPLGKVKLTGDAGKRSE